MPVSPLEMQVRILRRQKTCLEKRVRKLEELKRGAAVIRWARRYAGDPCHWNRLQLLRAVKFYEIDGLQRVQNATG